MNSFVTPVKKSFVADNYTGLPCRDGENTVMHRCAGCYARLLHPVDENVREALIILGAIIEGAVKFKGVTGG